jgi:AcrR family transcriptional regulator
VGMVLQPDRVNMRRGPYSKTAQRRVEIIEAATSVFAQRGYHGGSLRDISKQLGLSLTSLVHHFPTKSDLLEAVLDHADATWGASFASDVDEQGVKFAILRLAQLNFNHPELLRLLAILASEASSPDHPAHDWFVRRYQRFVEILQQMIETDRQRGRVRTDGDAAVLAKRVIAIWDGLQLQWLLDPHEDMIGEMRGALDDLLGGPRVN